MRTGVLCLLIGGSAFGQTPSQSAKDLTFEVATIKPWVPPQSDGRGNFIMLGKTGGPGTPDPGQITWPTVTVKQLLATAYDVKNYQITAPAWLDTERYSIVAKVPKGATAEQVNVMWQNLLAERFGLVLHHESKEFQVEELVVAKGGSKLKETALDPNAAPPPPGGRGPLKIDKNGFPELEGPGMITLMSSGPNGLSSHVVAHGQGLTNVVNMLVSQLNRPVVDKTGLTGKYDFTLEYTPDNARLNAAPAGAGGGDAGPGDNASEPGSTLTVAIQQQLGLRLNSSKAMLDVLIIDKANKEPTEN